MPGCKIFEKNGNCSCNLATSELFHVVCERKNCKGGKFGCEGCYHPSKRKVPVCQLSGANNNHPSSNSPNLNNNSIFCSLSGGNSLENNNNNNLHTSSPGYQMLGSNYVHLHGVTIPVNNNNFENTHVYTNNSSISTALETSTNNLNNNNSNNNNSNNNNSNNNNSNDNNSNNSSSTSSSSSSTNNSNNNSSSSSNSSDNRVEPVTLLGFRHYLNEITKLTGNNVKLGQEINYIVDGETYFGIKILNGETLALRAYNVLQRLIEEQSKST
jgi:hypothetical protein